MCRRLSLEVLSKPHFFVKIFLGSFLGPMDRAVRRVYEFGPFVLDPGERLLRHGATRMELPPRAFDILLVLVENSGRLLEKDALMQTVWRDTVVEENNLSQVVYLVRKALRDGEDGARYIETVPKRGYRFVGEVREFEPGRGNDNGRNGDTGFNSLSSSSSSSGNYPRASASSAVGTASSESEGDFPAASGAGTTVSKPPLRTHPHGAAGCWGW